MLASIGFRTHLIRSSSEDMTRTEQCRYSLPMFFTTSWDDGYAEDLAIADVLERHSLTGTFYLCPRAQNAQQMLTEAQVRNLASRHEIGAHSMTHPKLGKIPSDDARREIEDSKRWVEERTGTSCVMFCYPYGDFTPDVRRYVQDAGFRGARTVEALRFDGDDLYTLPTSLQVYPFPWRARYTRWWHPFDPLSRLRVSWYRLCALRIPLTDCRSWERLARRLFLRAVETDQPFFHLWGHSTELKRLGMSNSLEEFLAFVHTHRRHIEPVTNGELARRLARPA